VTEKPLILATICFEERLWVGTFERRDQDGYSIARHVFGKEPTDPEVYEFVCNHYQELNFGPPKDFTLQIKRMNPKRVQREVRREMETLKNTSKPSSFAQDYMREELEKTKKQRKQTASAENQARKDAQFEMKQRKKKKKHKGH